ncbi:hypothetical protein QP157_20950 [Sphingomonas sp. LR61]|uniref:FAD-dependent oxidoreductase n=1 Tax=Sphingomonas sp. LR61 TaxID=3050234 RepID=UPI002FDFC810
MNEYRSIIHVGGAGQRVLDRNATLLADLPDDGSMASPEARRGDIRRILLESLPDGTVQWGKKLRDVAPLGDGRHELTFTNGSTAHSDVLVGAEGTWSKVRALVSVEKPVYAGMSYIDTFLHDVDERHARRPWSPATAPCTPSSQAKDSLRIARRERSSTLT